MTPEEAKKRAEFAAQLGWRILETQSELKEMRKQLAELSSKAASMIATLDELNELVGRGDF